MTIEYLKSGKPDAERAEDDAKTKVIVEEILKNIEIDGDTAVRELSAKFDNYSPENFKLTEKEISDLIASLSDRELSDIKFAQEQVRNFAKAQRDSMLDIEIETIPGVILGHKNIPVQSVGCYVPGGSSLWLLQPICRLLLQQLLEFLELLPVLHLLKVSLMQRSLLQCI